MSGAVMKPDLMKVRHKSRVDVEVAEARRSRRAMEMVLSELKISCFPGSHMGGEDLELWMSARWSFLVCKKGPATSYLEGYDWPVDEAGRELDQAGLE
jgi:hypothetical protein